VEEKKRKDGGARRGSPVILCPPALASAWVVSDMEILI